MTITTFQVGAAVTPTVVKTYILHYANRKPRREKPTAHISYDEGLHLIRTFLKYASHHAVEDLQAFTSQWVPTPAWVRTESVTIPTGHVSKAAETLKFQLGPIGIEQVGGSQWWQWRIQGAELKADWIEMREHYNEHKRQATKSQRIMLYVHGGGYFFGSVDEHRYQMQRHARKLKARVFAPRYRLAPQFPFPCGLHDCLAAYLYLLSVHDPTEIVFAGDSAGGGMVVSLLCILRDQGLPLPAGAVLISPWVDLTHSFPSLTGSTDFDYIPNYGFMHKPSAAWPPPNDDEFATISKMAKVATVSDKTSNEEASTDVPTTDAGCSKPGPQLHLSIELDGKSVVLKDQIQMYATNQLLAHPLVSPVLQPSLGGLPPVLVLTGGGEILRDEQIYLAHKMANPSKYPLGAAYRSKYDPDDVVLKRYKPTSVQLQVWEDLCHVAPTLSFTRPAKFMYRSIAQFGAWTLAKAQKRAIEIVDDDDISIISSQTDSDSQSDADMDSSTDSMAKAKLDANKTLGSVGMAGDPIPPFEKNMIRQRVDRHGRIYPLADASELPAMQMHPDEVGVVKPGPVRKWLEAKHQWDTKYSGTRKRIQKARVKALASGKIIGFEAGERPPPSALAGRRTGKDDIPKKRKSYGLAMWSGWGSRHDESTIKREEEATTHDEKVTVGARSEAPDIAVEEAPAPDDGQAESEALPAVTQRPSYSRRRSTGNKRTLSESRNRSRKRTISVTDRGQAEGRNVPPIVPTNYPAVTMQSPGAMTDHTSPGDGRATSPNPSMLSAGFIPKFKTGGHLRLDSVDTAHGHVTSDAASAMTGRSAVFPDDVSTRAVFAAPGVLTGADKQDLDGIKPYSPATADRPRSPLSHEGMGTISHEVDLDDGAASLAPSAMSRPYPGLGGLGSDSPRSQRSLDRLQSHQQDEGMGQFAPLRSPSSTAIVRAEGVVDAIDGRLEEDETANNDSKEVRNIILPERQTGNNPATEIKPADSMSIAQENVPVRPNMYDRQQTEFQTALEKAS